MLTGGNDSFRENELFTTLDSIHQTQSRLDALTKLASEVKPIEERLERKRTQLMELEQHYTHGTSHQQTLQQELDDLTKEEERQIHLSDTCLAIQTVFHTLPPSNL